MQYRLKQSRTNLKKSSYEKINQEILAVTRPQLVSCTRCMRRVYFRAHRYRYYFKAYYVMKLLSKVNLEETDFLEEEYFRDEAFEVEELIGGRKVSLYFDVEVVVYYYDNYIDGRFESRHVSRRAVSVEYDCGYFTDDGDLVPLSDKEIKDLEKKVEKLIKEVL